MQEITQQGNELYLENTSLNGIANQYGTPSYVYSKAAITDSYHAYTKALGDYPGKICYAVKANSNLAILQILAALGAHFDIVSGGELERVLRAGGAANQIIFSGVGKSKAEMERALELGIACFNVESEAELVTLSAVAEKMNKQANISLRVNPDVDANTHPYISTGLKENKFGIAIDDAVRIYSWANTLPNINIVGVDCHIGSQLTDITPFLDALDRLLILIDQLQEAEITIQHIDLGGGIGVVYRDETPPAIDTYLAKVKEKIAPRGLELVLEPGRSIVGNAGLLLTEVMYLKPGEHKNFAVVDAAMNDNIRPALYQAWQDLKPVVVDSEEQTLTWDIVGPICETSDFLAKERELALKQGDRLALLSSGAYGFVMASNYNTRNRAPEILVDGDKSYLIRERESFADLIRGEHLLENI
ncbi:diaminopimelate decarboxylase [Agarilytica rhodophyticola]|uniref:diaminopimelate decarboxylase n=1 Tax=Agarilytica rhodophyticola TaxID=1737490 RepID=UPI000B34324F|nr:diaminopimelate decarboxylase [Agarilytica rhodophyticola]